jgi:hypothetical protein
MRLQLQLSKRCVSTYIHNHSQTRAANLYVLHVRAKWSLALCDTDNNFSTFLRYAHVSQLVTASTNVGVSQDFISLFIYLLIPGLVN